MRMTLPRAGFRGVSTAALAGLLAVGALAGPARAAEPTPEPDTGGWGIDVTSPADRLPMTPASRAKVQEALASYLKTPGLTLLQQRSAQTQLAAVGGSASGTTTQATSTPDALAVIAAAPTSRTLTYTYSSQIKSYFCGPASAWMIIQQNGVASSRDGDNRALTQTNLARFEYLQTEYRGATTWASQAMQYGIQTWMNGAGWGYVQVQSPTAAVVQGALLRVIGTHGHVIAADTVEYAGGAHYNGHPANQTIGHWIVGYGYAGSGATSYWADPSIYYFTSAKSTFSASTSSFTSTYLQANGVLY